MSTILIKTQDQLDSLPNSFDSYTVIRIESIKTIRISKSYVNALVAVYNNVSVEAYGNASVEAYGGSSVVAYGNASVEAYGNTYVEAYDNARVNVYDNSCVKAYGGSSVVAYQIARVRIYDNASVIAYDKTSVTAYDKTSVVAYGNASVVAYGNASVEAYDKTSVVAYHNALVRAYGNALVSVYDNVSARAHNNVSTRAYNNASVEAYNDARVSVYDKTSVEAYGNASVAAYGSASVELFLLSYAVILSSQVTIKKLMDHTTAILKGCSPEIEDVSDTAVVRKVRATINVSFEEWLRRGYVFADGINKKIKSQKTIGEIQVFECEEFNKKSSFVVKKGDLFSHGKTVAKAIEDLRFKISDRDTSKYDYWKKDKEQNISIDEAIQGYRTITGACEYGTKDFIRALGDLPKEISIKEIVSKTEGAFGNKELKIFLDMNNEQTGGK